SLLFARWEVGGFQLLARWRLYAVESSLARRDAGTTYRLRFNVSSSLARWEVDCLQRVHAAGGKQNWSDSLLWRQTCAHLRLSGGDSGRLSHYSLDARRAQSDFPPGPAGCHQHLGSTLGRRSSETSHRFYRRSNLQLLLGERWAAARASAGLPDQRCCADPQSPNVSPGAESSTRGRVWPANHLLALGYLFACRQSFS